MRKKYKSVNEYLDDFEGEIKEKLIKIRELVLENASGAEERIGYNIAAYYFNGKPLFYFAGFKNHISIFPTPGVLEEFKTDLSGYKSGKGTVQFPNSEKLPLKLIRQIIIFRYNSLKK